MRLRIKILFLPALLILFSACSSVATRNGQAPCDEGGRQRVKVVNHGWHTGLVIPYAQARGQLGFLDQRFAGARALEIGWGDEGFYRSREITAGLAVQAVFWPTPSVLHVVEVPMPAEEYFPAAEVKSVELDARGFEQLLRFIGDTFARDEQGQLIPLSEGNYGRRSQFYRARGKYHLFRTCNSWTEKALGKGGMEMSATPTLTASGVMAQIPRQLLLAGSCGGEGGPQARRQAEAAGR